MRACACASRGDAAFASKPHHIARTRATSLSALLQVTSHCIGAAQSWPGLACSRPKNRLPIHPLPEGPITIHECFALFLFCLLEFTPLRGWCLGLAGLAAVSMPSSSDGSKFQQKGPRGRPRPSIAVEPNVAGVCDERHLFPSGL